MESVMADPTSIRRKDPDRILREALEAAVTNYSRRKGNCFDVACGEFIDDDGEYYAVSAKPRSTQQRKEISQWDAILRVASGRVRRIPRNTYEWKALRMALYPEERVEDEDEDAETHTPD
jgi:hypothetical protein